MTKSNCTISLSLRLKKRRSPAQWTHARASPRRPHPEDSTAGEASTLGRPPHYVLRANVFQHDSSQRSEFHSTTPATSVNQLESSSSHRFTTLRYQISEIVQLIDELFSHVFCNYFRWLKTKWIRVLLPLSNLTGLTNLLLTKIFHFLRWDRWRKHHKQVGLLFAEFSLVERDLFEATGTLSLSTWCATKALLELAARVQVYSDTNCCLPWLLPPYPVTTQDRTVGGWYACVLSAPGINEG